jgi:hypothetical protein
MWQASRLRVRRQGKINVALHIDRIGPSAIICVAGVRQSLVRKGGSGRSMQFRRLANFAARARKEYFEDSSAFGQID